jgi:hypothetical protein
LALTNTPHTIHTYKTHTPAALGLAVTCCVLCYREKRRIGTAHTWSAVHADVPTDAYSMDDGMDSDDALDDDDDEERMKGR